MTHLTYKNRISVAEICFYGPVLFLAIFLFVRHGLGRNVPWFYLAVFCCIRIIGASLQLDTIWHPLSIPINTASMILQSIGISPLMLMTLSILGGLVSNIKKTRKILLQDFHLRFVQLLVILGLVLGIVGGVKAGNTFKRTWHFQMPVEGEVGLGFICGGYALLLLSTIVVACHIANIPEGEKRLLAAVAASMPFILVRVVYGSLAIFTKDARFNQLTGSTSYLLGMAVLMEIITVTICVGTGSTLRWTTWEEEKEKMAEIKAWVRSRCSNAAAQKSTATSDLEASAQVEDINSRSLKPQIA